MASMSLTSSELILPKVTNDTGEKIATLLLNPNQIDIIMDLAKWKVIKGCFGSGKSVCIKEIARCLYMRKDGCKIYYICFDTYSLMEAETHIFFQSISSDEQLQSLSLSEVCKAAGYSVEDFCNYCGPAKRNIADLFEYLKTTNGGNCHILVDEFHVDDIDKEYCDKLKLSQYFLSMLSS